MKNSFSILIICLLISIFDFNPLYAEDEFKFNITEVDITENGELILGSKGGKAVTQDGFEIIAENFLYNKLTNILDVYGNVKLISQQDGIVIFTDKATYLKNDEIIFTEGNSKAINEIYEITAIQFKYKKKINILEAKQNVKFVDKKNNTFIFSDKATYLKNDEIIFTEGNSKALVEHGVKIENNCHLSTGSIANGDCLIKTGSFIGSNATIIQKITIGSNSVVGAGKIVKKNLPINSVYK